MCVVSGCDGVVVCVCCFLCIGVMFVLLSCCLFVCLAVLILLFCLLWVLWCCMSVVVLCVMLDCDVVCVHVCYFWYTCVLFVL